MVAVLVSGAEAHVVQVAATLRARGATVTEVLDLAEVPTVCAAAGSAAFDSYVQLPANFRVEGGSAIERVHHFYAEGVLARFTALKAALPSLTPGARVTFVLGTLPPDAATIDDRDARRALTKVLAHAARADAPDGDLVVRMLDSDSTADQIGLVALGEDPQVSPPSDQLADMSYSDWRIEMMGVVLVET